MNNDSIISYVLAGFAAAIPIAVWLYIILKKGTKDRKHLVLSFFGGIIAISALMLLKTFWESNPKYDIFSYIGRKINDPKTFYATTYITVGVLEEIVKQFLLRYLDTKKAVVRSIGDSIKFSLVAALGFAFAENIFYFQSVYANTEGITGVLIITFVFRSTFTTAGHMCFSGLFGYFYGLARFSSNLEEEAKIEGKNLYFTRFISRLFNLAQAGIIRRKFIIEGLLTAILIHGVFNFILSMEEIWDVSPQMPTILAMLLVLFSYLYLQYLRNKNTAQLQLFNDVSLNKVSKMSERDETVILHLLSTWLNEKKYNDVVASADRLLSKNPNSASAQILKAKAIDALQGQNAVYKSMLSALKENPSANQNDKSVMKNLDAQKATVEKNKVIIDTSHDNDTYHI